MTRNTYAGVIILLLLFIGPVRGQSQDSATRGVEVEVQGFGKVTIPDIVVQDQDGRKGRFYSDLIKDKVVVLSFFYTSCTFVCTRQGKVFSELQSLLGERLGKSVFLISVTSDPVRDNPERLKAWAERYKANSGWILITGEEAEMNKLLHPFTGNKAGRGALHVPSTFFANGRTGVWTSAVGVSSPEHLLETLNSIQD